MKKIQLLLLLNLVLLPSIISIAQNGRSTGLYGTFQYSTMPNRDDLDADNRLDYVTSFRYGGGFEKMSFLNNNFGWGIQMGYHGAGQDYKGIIDTFTKYTYTASTKLNYGKTALLVYYRSYNRYNPQARFRFSSFLGPYVSFLANFNDSYLLYDKDAKLIAGSNSTGLGTSNTVGTKITTTYKEPMYKYFEWGFTIAPGFQYMITPKFALCFNVRADISASNVENTGNLKKVIPGPPYEEKFDRWKDLYSKYSPYDQYNVGIKKDSFDIRGTTKNLTIGAQITLRFYADAQYMK